MNAWGWLFLIFSWGFIIVLAAFCFYKIFSKKSGLD